MDNLLKSLIAFIFCSTVATSTSLEDLRDTQTNSVSLPNRELISKFYESNSFTKKFIEPVIKINFEITVGLSSSIMASGTGFSVKYNKAKDETYIITNNHICENKYSISLESRLFYESSKNIGGPNIADGGNLEIISYEPILDLCLLKAKGYIRPVTLGNESSIRQGLRVITVGAPNGIYPTIDESFVGNLFSREVVSQTINDGYPFLLLSSLSFGGQSGSPIFNKDGEVIGVIFMSLNDPNGPVYGTLGIHIEDVRSFLRKNNIIN